MGLPSTAAQEVTPGQLRALLNQRVGSLDKLRVPDRDEDLPQPRLPSGEIDPRFRITAAKRYLGKLLFHDPIRANAIRPEFGGVMSTAQTASCGSCHFGDAATKAGQVINLAVGGEGRMEMARDGQHVFDRAIIEGLVDAVPTPLEITGPNGEVMVSGRFDAVDSVPRVSPSMIGFAFNNRLLLGGAAGEPYDPGNPAKANKNPDNLPAGENLAQLAFKAHRMAETQNQALQANAIYRKLFADAYPEEHARYLQTGDLSDTMNEDTTIRAVAAFLRTVITRETPWDRFLAGDDGALTARRLRGGWLFAAPAGQGGGGCISCHSGPALNKQLGDEAGLLVEENFRNLGLGDHPLQELARQVLQDPTHHDIGRGEVTANPAHNFRFKVPTLRQLRDAAPFMHSGQIGTLRRVIEYFNAGVPLDACAGSLSVADCHVDPAFTNPRGPGGTGLGLNLADIDALLDFLENGLYDPGLVKHIPGSRTRTFDPNLEDLTYSEELKALGAVDGFLPSKMAIANDDPLSRHQMLFIRGEVNGDHRVDLADAIFVLVFLFRDPALEPDPMIAADMNDDEHVDLSDPIYLLEYLFLGGPRPAAPYPGIGADFTR
ncbi:MAG: hypothetical protein HY717_19690 [Planctomycetes bacterium]|nr:hypothetical protein [Planctomycetota bacterium]